MSGATPIRVAVLVSGRGSNLAALLEAIERGGLAAQVVGVFSDRPQAPALARARAAGVATRALRPGDFPDRLAFDQALFAGIAQVAPDLIVLAGFMRILDPRAFAPWLGRIINIHPSLLPKYPGLDTHRRALQAGATEHGASVHFVSAELDGGPVISRTSLAVRRDDTPESLAQRLLPLEHHLLVETVRLFAQHRIDGSDGDVRIDGRPIDSPLNMHDNAWQR